MTLKLYCLLLAAVCLLSAANIKLFLKDGTYQLAREYKVEGDRVSFLSVDRDEWEDLPLSLVDLEKTKAAIKQHEEAAREEAKSIKEEEKALKEAAHEIQRVPKEEGAYLVEGDKITPVKVAEFYIRLSEDERFGILRMGEHKGNRVVEKLTIVPVTKETVEEPDMVDTFRRQVGDQVYKIWPQKPLDPGEYAVVEYTEGKVNMQVWDFFIR
jgi:hypothetical protein